MTINRKSIAAVTLFVSLTYVTYSIVYTVATVVAVCVPFLIIMYGGDYDNLYRDFAQLYDKIMSTKYLSSVWKKWYSDNGTEDEVKKD